MGRSIINWGGVTDSQLDGNSEHPLTNKAATAEFLRQQNLMTEQISQVTSLIDAVKLLTATLSTKGMTQLTTSTTITDPNAFALSGTEKNATIAGSLMSLIQGNGNAITEEITNRVNNDNYINGRVDTEITNRVNNDTWLKSEIDAAKNECMSHLNGRITTLDTGVHNYGSVLEWVGSSGSNTGTYVEITPICFADRPPVESRHEIVYFKFGANGRIVVLAVPYGDVDFWMFHRSWFGGAWLNPWRRFCGA